MFSPASRAALGGQEKQNDIVLTHGKSRIRLDKPVYGLYDWGIDLELPMPTPKGGRGHKAPYEQVMVRCPRPVENEVKRIIAEYRGEVTATEAEKRQIPIELDSQSQIESALKLVDDFVEQIGQTEHLNERSRRNNVNLARFRAWLIEQTNQ